MAASLISGNTGNGIHITAATGNKLLGNGVGSNAAGTGALPNSDAGIRIAAPDNFVGAFGTSYGVVAGNTGDGIALEAPGHDTVRQTAIGVGIPVSTAIANGGDGIDINGSNSNLIGGTLDFHYGNAIGANGGSGVFVHAGSAGNRIIGNLVGLIFAVSQPNGIDGVWLDASSGNLIQGNLLGNNTFNGVSVSSGATGDAISRNYTVGNGNLGIDLGLDGATPDDAGDVDGGDNLRQNFPLISGYLNAPGTVTIGGSLPSAANTVYTVEFFANTSCDGSGFGEGAPYLGAKKIKTGPGGTVTFSVKLKTSGSVSHISATATDPAGNTSEFSPCVP